MREQPEQGPFFVAAMIIWLPFTVVLAFFELLGALFDRG